MFSTIKRQRNIRQKKELTMNIFLIQVLQSLRYVTMELTPLTTQLVCNKHPNVYLVKHRTTVAVDSCQVSAQPATTVNQGPRTICQQLQLISQLVLGMMNVQDFVQSDITVQMPRWRQSPVQREHTETTLGLHKRPTVISALRDTCVIMVNLSSLFYWLWIFKSSRHNLAFLSFTGW